MKKILAIIAIVSALPASSMTLRWDASPSAGVTNYNVYAAIGTNTLQPLVRVGTNTSMRIDFTTNGIWKFAITAERNGVESDLSTILTLDVPERPPNFRTFEVQAIGTLSGGVWTNAGYFRLQIVP